MAAALSLVDSTPTPENPRKTTRRGRPRSVFQAAQSGSDVQLLTALRDRIAKTIADPNTAARDLAPLTRRMVEVNNELKAAVVAEREEAERRALKAAKNSGDEAWEEV